MQCAIFKPRVLKLHTQTTVPQNHTCHGITNKINTKFKNVQETSG